MKQQLSKMFIKLTGKFNDNLENLKVQWRNISKSNLIRNSCKPNIKWNIRT